MPATKADKARIIREANNNQSKSIPREATENAKFRIIRLLQETPKILYDDEIEAYKIQVRRIKKFLGV